MFHLGKEIPIYFEGESDGVFNNGDFILFHGEKNRGDLDSLLYDNPQKMVNPFYSLFSDTAVYFITYLDKNSSKNGLRYSTNSEVNTSLPIEPFYMHSELKEYNDMYSFGKPYEIFSFSLHYSEYEEGEGWVSPRFGINQGATRRLEAVNALGLNTSAGVDAQVEFSLVGLSNSLSAFRDHSFELKVGQTSGNTQMIFDTIFEGYSMIKEKINFPLSNVGSPFTYFEFLPRVINGVTAHGNAVGYLRFTYPRNFDFLSTATFNFSLDSSLTKRRVRFTNYSNGTDNSPMVFDVLNGVHYKPIMQSNNRMFEIVVEPSAKGNEFQIVDMTRTRALGVEPSRLINIHSSHPDSIRANCQFNIVTGERLLGDEMTEYLGYKKSKYASSVLTVEQLYDIFTYGVRHPLAIRRYSEFILDNYIGFEPEFLLLIGRGYENQLFRKSTVSQNKLTVPALGVPASDNMFTYKLKGSSVSPRLATGRLAFDDKKDIRNYLDKLKVYEDNSELAVWRKDIIHLGGGKDGGQSNEILRILNRLNPYVQSEPLGGEVSTFSKSASGIVSPFVKDNTIKRINDGVNMITFLGHGSTTLIDLDIGDTTDLSNEGKYPIYFFNGCTIGNPNLGFNKFGELFYSEQVVKAQKKGGIAFIGQSSTSELYTVSDVMENMYKQIYLQGYGKSLGVNLRSAMDTLYKKNATPLSWLHATQTFLQGDPSVSSFSPELPDYLMKRENIFIYPEDAISLSDSFAVAVIIDNVGKVPKDSSNVSVRRYYPEFRSFQDTVVRIAPVFRRDTVYVWFKSKDLATTGINYVDVNLNSSREFDEFTYLNNSVERLPFELRGNGINLISPDPFAIVSGDTATLLVNAMNLTENPQDFVFELDTNPNFNSPFYRTSNHLAVGPVASVKFALQNGDSVVYYWRCRLARDQKEGGFFKQRSFTNIKVNKVGWSQAHFPEFNPHSDNKSPGLVVDTLQRTYDFGLSEKAIWIDTDVKPAFKGVKLGGGFSSKDINAGVCYTGFVVMLFNKYTLDLEFHPTMIPRCPSGNDPDGFSNRQIFYNFNVRWGADQLLFKKFIEELDEGTHVALFSMSSAFSGNWYQDVPAGGGTYVGNALSMIGGRIMDTIADNGYLYTCLGRKGNKKGEAYEEARFKTYTSVEGKMIGKLSTGSIVTEAIGPSSEWGRGYYNLEAEPSDSFNIDVYGVRIGHPDSLILKNIIGTNFDVSRIDAKRFPFIRLKGDFFDETGRTPPQLVNWRVTHEGLPEGTINILKGYEHFNGRDTVLEGEVYNSKIPFENVSKYKFDSILVVSSLIETATRKLIWSDTTMISDLKPDEWDFYSRNIETLGLKGEYGYTVQFNPGPAQPEVKLVNNTLTEYIYVKVDELNPILDVTFDGKHIVNGDLVSSSPKILITSKDENRVLLQDDSSYMKLYLKAPGGTNFVEIDMTSSEVIYYPATNSVNMAMLEYNPLNLMDGEYVLRVQSYDKTGNEAGEKPYEITFKIIRETQISNFYPYPNPFTSSTRFVFTLTGNEIPDHINIKIMTITGKVVKEISKEELGPITIGNNVSEYAWDGKDEFGDRLANGVYLYKVTVKHNGESVKSYSTEGDGSFKNNYGKLYLMR